MHLSCISPGCRGRCPGSASRPAHQVLVFIVDAALLKTIACGHACRHYRSLRDRCRAGVSFPFAGRNPGSEIGKACHLAPNHHRCLWPSNASERYRRHRREVIVIRRPKFERRMTRSHELYFFRFRMVFHGFSLLSRRSVDTMASFRRETAQAALPRAQRSLAQPIHHRL